MLELEIEFFKKCTTIKRGRLSQTFTKECHSTVLRHSLPSPLRGILPTYPRQAAGWVHLKSTTPNHRQIHNKPDHLPSLVVEAGLEQVRPFCCWYTPPTFHTHFNRILCAVNMFIGVLFKEKYHLYTNNAQD